MLIDLFEWLTKNVGKFPGAGLWQYLTFRAGLAVILSLIISMVLGGKIIALLRRKQIGETVRDLGLAGQSEKAGTPTMGGVIIIVAILVPTLLVAKLSNIYILLMITATLWMGLIGFADDYIKVFKKNKKGLSGWFKILGQVGLGLLIGLAMVFHQDIYVRIPSDAAAELKLADWQRVEHTSVELPADRADYQVLVTNVPFLKNNWLDYSRLLPIGGESLQEVIGRVLFVLIVIFIITAVSNAANLTDGLDGLATGVSGIIAFTLGIFAYVSGNAITANYLNILHVPGAGELLIYAASLTGACLGFLWYNSYPAKVFMGDTGSLTLGGIIAALAIVLRKELLIPVLCGIFLVESLSVILQVGYFKYTKKKYGEGRRLFRMSPLHHHYQKLGMHEAKIVARFWIIGILLAVVTIITLKIR
ncbi:MAG: phospho-N-acetylmuramoyl-pentapeptide-transferase [Saprospiraceae bacterium]|nr:phospho-N-acetylmuramoyl-pentapeptide-transferase [Saprospiraceae bacterium]